MAIGREWFSTAGAALPAGEIEAAHGAVELRRVAAPSLLSLPETLRLGAGCPTTVAIGKHEENQVVLELSGASEVQCQLALRSFRLPEQDKVHQALFLRDVSSTGTLVNGVAAFRPWHWVQDGDAIGIPDDSGDQSAVINFFTVHYCDLRRLPAALVTIEAPALGQTATNDIPQKVEAGAIVPVQGGRGAHGAVSNRRGRRPGSKRYGNEILGRVIDVRYQDYPDPYRARIVQYDKKSGHHHIHSRGLSTWDDESFEDEIDFNDMYGKGEVKFIDASGDSEEDPVEPRRPKKRGRGGRR